MSIASAAQFVIAAAVTAALVWASVTDVRQRRIPNLVVGVLLGLFVAWTAASLGAHLVSGLAAGGAALAATVALYALGVFGAGDSKLFAAAALFMGLGYLPYFAVATALAGGGLALVSLARDPVRAMAVFTLRGKGDAGRGVPYGVAIGLGAALVLWAAVTGWLLPYGYGHPPHGEQYRALAGRRASLGGVSSDRCYAEALQMNASAATRQTRTRLLKPAVAFLIVVTALIQYALFSSRPISHDVAWLLDATGRWLHGAVLYRDIMELNPPWVFYLTAGMTFASASKSAFVGGVCLATAVSALLCLRNAGAAAALAALVAIVCSGLTDFGEREHLALIFSLPLVLAADRRGTAGAALGAWTFLGVALKPVFLLMPLLAAVGSCISTNSLRALFEPPLLVLGALGAGYLAAVWLLHPLYFTNMAPLALLVYGGYKLPQPTLFTDLVITGAMMTLAASLLRPPVVYRAAGALAAAIAIFFVQGKGWSYQAVPAAGLAIATGYMLLLSERSLRAVATLPGVVLIVSAIWLQGPYQSAFPDLIPPDARSVEVLGDNVSAGYPDAFERGVRMTSRYPTLWTLPGAWSLAASHDPKMSQSARAVLAATRENILTDIKRGRPDYILVDERVHKSYFDRPFDYLQFLGSDPRLASYVEGGRRGAFRVLRRRPF